MHFSKRASTLLACLAITAAASWAAGIIAEPYIGRYVVAIDSAAITATLILVMVILWLKTRDAMTAAWVKQRDEDKDYLLRAAIMASQRAARSVTAPQQRLQEPGRRLRQVR